MWLIRDNSKARTHDTSEGFTILELMIATVVFSSILIFLTFSLIAVSDHYYRGVVQSKTQSDARDILANIGQAIEFGTTNGTVPVKYNNSGTNVYWFCINNQLYAYQLGDELSTTTNHNPGYDQTTEAFIQTSISGSCPSTGVTIDDTTNTGIQITSGGNPVVTGPQTELLGQNMRLSNLTITNNGLSNGLVQISLQVTYGSDSVLTNPPTGPSPSCDGQVGFRFCAFSTLTTILSPRVTQGS